MNDESIQLPVFESNDKNSPVISNGYDPCGGRDNCRCGYDYRGEVDEIYCPRCHKQVADDYYDDNYEDKYITAKNNSEAKIKFTISNSWSSTKKGISCDKKEFSADKFRLRRKVIKDLHELTGYASLKEEDYNADSENDHENKSNKLKKLTKKNQKRKKHYTKQKNTPRKTF